MSALPWLSAPAFNPLGLSLCSLNPLSHALLNRHVFLYRPRWVLSLSDKLSLCVCPCASSLLHSPSCGSINEACFHDLLSRFAWLARSVRRLSLCPVVVLPLSLSPASICSLGLLCICCTHAWLFRCLRWGILTHAGWDPRGAVPGRVQLACVGAQVTNFCGASRISAAGDCRRTPPQQRRLSPHAAPTAFVHFSAARPCLRQPRGGTSAPCRTTQAISI